MANIDESTTKTNEFVKQLRIDNKMTQEDLANKLFCHITLISKWENNKVPIDFKHYQRLCEIFGVSLEELVAGERITKTNEKDVNQNFIKWFTNRDIKYKKIKILAGVISILLFVLSFTFLVYYFYQTYNTTKVFRINGETDNSLIYDGLIVISKENSYFVLGEVKPHVDSIKVYYKLGNEDHLIFEGNPNTIITDFTGYNSAINLRNYNNIINLLYVDIIYNDQLDTIKLNVSKEYANTNVMFKDKQNITTESSSQVSIKIPDFVSKNYKCSDNLCSYTKNNLDLVFSINENTLYISNKDLTLTADYNFTTKAFNYSYKNNSFTINKSDSMCSENCTNNENIFKEYYINYIEPLEK